jgi:hypothetical protein
MSISIESYTVIARENNLTQSSSECKGSIQLIVVIIKSNNSSSNVRLHANFVRKYTKKLRISYFRQLENSGQSEQ